MLGAQGQRAAFAALCDSAAQSAAAHAQERRQHETRQAHDPLRPGQSRNGGGSSHGQRMQACKGQQAHEQRIMRIDTPVHGGTCLALCLAASAQSFTLRVYAVEHLLLLRCRYMGCTGHRSCSLSMRQPCLTLPAYAVEHLLLL